MRKRSYFLLSVIFVVLLVSCSGTSVITEKVEVIDLSLGTTIGNHTYLPLAFKQTPDSHVLEILQVLDFFEKENPELEVTSWAVQQTETRTKGLWINHKPAP